MFHGGTVLRQAIEGVRRRLPPGWTAEERADSTLRLSGPDRRSVEVPIIARKGVVPRDVPALLSRTEKPVMVVASYLGERARELLAQGGASYADATGNVR